MQASRCRQSSIECAKFSNVSSKNLCEQKIQIPGFQTSFADIVTPRMVCPLKAANYVFKGSSIDLSAITALPIDGYIWKLKVELAENQNDKLVEVGCAFMQVRISISSSRKG